MAIVFLNGAWAFNSPTTTGLSFHVAEKERPSLSSQSSTNGRRTLQPELFMSDRKTDDGVIELAEDDDENEKPAVAAAAEDKRMVAPFISQGELADDVLNPDLSDPKQTRVILYIIISLLPVLFLIPLMIGRELIPLEALPPVDL